MVVNLSARGVRSLKPADHAIDLRDRVICGLELRVLSSGEKVWSVRYRMVRHQRRLQLGVYPVLSLAEARKRAKAALREASAGRDPAAAKAERREADTFGELAADYLEKYAMVKKRSWKDDRRRLEKKVPRAWKHILAKDITRRDVRALVERVATTGPIEANRVRALLHKVFAFAVSTDVIAVNPVTGTPRPGVERQRDRVLSDEEIRTLWAALDKQPIEMAAAFKLRLLTAQRGGEVHNLRWADVDLDSGWWTIPASDSKNKLPHRVPLSCRALEILTTLRDARDAAIAAKPTRPAPVNVLKGARGKRQRGDAAATFGLENFKGHDLRRTAASGMASAGVQRLVISKILNHVERGVTAVYDRHSYDAEKRIGLDTWGRTLTAILEAKRTADVLPFARSGQ